MTPRALFPALLGLCLFFLPTAPAWPGMAGSADSISGSATISSQGAQPRPLRVADQLNEGDLLATGAESWVLLDMVDGATFTLRPNTQLRIDAYVYSESEASKNKSFLSLIQGAFRAITGAIGTRNRPSYTITTPTATIGIRGTDHETAYYPPGTVEAGTEPGTYDKVNEGETFIRSPQGEVRVRPGQVGFAHHRADQKPRVLASIPAFYRRHAEIDRRLVDRVKAIREKRRQKRPGLQQERANSNSGGRQHSLVEQRAHREQILEQRRKQEHEGEKEKKRQRRE
jgi:FecR protein